MLERKGLGIRIAAYIIDAVLMTVLLSILSVIGAMVPVVGFLLLLAALAYPAIEVIQGRSPAKMMLGLSITSQDGTPVTRDQLILRTLIKCSPLILGVVTGSLNLLVGSSILALLVSFAQLGLAIALLVLSLQTMQTVRLAFWDIKAKTAVMGLAAVGMPVQPVQQPIGQPLPPVPSQQ